MTSQQILQADFLDILFDNRNKEYGAYALRKSYNTEIVKALVIAVSTVFLLLFFINPSVNNTAIFTDDGGIILKPYDIPMPPKPKQDLIKPQLPKLPQIKQQEYQNLKFVDNQQVKPLATQDELSKAAVSSITVDGPEIKDWVEPAKPAVAGSGIASKPDEVKNETVVPDQQPQFPGGMQAWAAFLNRNLHAPQELESGEKRVVNIRFHVDEDGSITNFQIVQSGGAAFDNEVIRVLKRMPKWMPALQAGKPVAVSFTQPVTFVGVEE